MFQHDSIVSGVNAAICQNSTEWGFFVDICHPVVIKFFNTLND
jgi:hypothetical protein